jgi:endonuclease YncB( thermonuclease family)
LVITLVALAATLAAQSPISTDFENLDWLGVPRAPDSACWVQPTIEAQLLAGEYPPRKQGGPVVDGDTLRMEGLKESLRLVGVDCEETFKTSAKDKQLKALAAKDWDEYLKTVLAGTTPARPPKFASPMGEAARIFAQHFFDGVTKVRVELDDLERGIDYYGRQLCHVLVEKDGKWVNFNVELVRQGLSPYFVKYGHTRRFHENFLAAEKEAQANSRGIFGKPPKLPAYPDYELRLKWWHERDRALEYLNRREKAEPTMVLLGLDREWKQALDLADQQATIAGSASTLRHVSAGFGWIALGHRSNKDFLIVGSIEKLKQSPLVGFEGDYVLVTGKVSLHEGKPQMKLEDVTSVVRVPVE